MTNLEQAIQLAVKAHTGQVDEDGMPHIVHCFTVMANVQKEANHTAIEGISIGELLIAAILHDVVEDTSVTLADIRAMFGVHPEGGKTIGEVVAEIVDGVSRRKDETYKDFIYRAKKHPGARLLKIADLLANMGRLDKISPKKASWRNKLEFKYATALKVLNDIDEPTWEQASYSVTTEGPHSHYFVADPNGKQIEVTEEEFKLLMRKADA